MSESTQNCGTNAAYLDLSGANTAPGNDTPQDVRVVIVRAGRFELKSRGGDAANSSASPSSFDLGDEQTVRALVQTLQRAEIQKLFCRTTHNQQAPEFANALRDVGIDPVFLTESDSAVAGTTTAADFMDEEDSAAVAERLRALGYL